MRYVRRWVITHISDEWSRTSGPLLRRLTLAQQGRFTYDSPGAAEADLETLRGPDGLPRVLSPTEVASLDVREVDCYPGNHDPVRYYVD